MIFSMSSPEGFKIASNFVRTSKIWGALLVLGVFISGCSSSSKVGETPIGNLEAIPEDSEYLKLVDQNTREAFGYNGLANVFEIRALALNERVVAAQVRRKSQQFQWSEEQTRREFEKANQSASSQLQFFISFFTPDGNHNDLSNSSTLWKVFLDVNGKRYSASVEKAPGKLTELQNLFPFHNQFSNGYFATVLAPRSLIEQGAFKLTITGPVATQELVY